MNISINISEPRYPTPQTLTKDDVWGNPNGMIVGRSSMTCPHFKDHIPYKSVTIKVPKNIYLDGTLLSEVMYWIEYVQGTDSVEKTDTDDEGNLYIRCNYMCW